MALSKVALAGSMLLLSSVAHAQPVADMAAWTQGFKQAALKNDAEAMLDAIRAAGDPRLNLESIKLVLHPITALIGTKTAEYVEEFGEKNVGTFFKRINIAVKYPGSILFYSVVAARDDAGWQIIQLNVDGNLNKILDAPWPG